MNTLVLGDFNFGRLYRFLRGKAVRIQVLAYRPPEAGLYLGPDVEWRVSEKRIDHAVILRAVDEMPADLVIPCVRGTENERDAIEHALAAQLGPRRTIFGTHSVPFAETVTDKVAFHRFAVAHDLPVPRGQVVSSLDSALAAVPELGGFPVILKDPQALATRGVRLGADRGELAAAFEVLNGRELLIQERLIGEELGVEIVAGRHGNCWFPLISMGRLDGKSNPQCRIRRVPRHLNAKATQTLADAVATIGQELCPRGPWQLDLAFSNNQIYILEVNPRLGGLSNLSYYSTGIDPWAVACAAAMGEPLPARRVTGAAFEIPVMPDTHVDMSRFPDLMIEVRKFRSLPCWQVSVGGPDLERVASFLDHIPSENLWLPRTEVMATIEQGFRELKLHP